MHTTKKIIYFFLAVALLSLNACKTNVSRNGDGSATVETTISQEELQEVITSSIADPLVTSVTASLQSGYVLVSADRKRWNDATKTDELSFRLDLSVNNGQLIASVSNAQLDGIAIEQNRVDNWNQTIANRLSRIGQKNNKATLESVSVTPDMVSMIWVVTK